MHCTRRGHQDNSGVKGVGVGGFQSVEADRGRVLGGGG